MQVIEAPISLCFPGDSGGPLVSEEGELVAILSAGCVLMGDPRYAQEEMEGFGWDVVYNCGTFASVTSEDTKCQILEAILSVGGQSFSVGN